MLSLLWLVPAVPFASALILALVGGRFSKTMVAIAGAGSVGLAALISLALVPASLAAPTPYTQVLWTWINVAGFKPEIAFYLDPVSLLMVVVVTFVGFLIHLYSAESMEQDEGYSR
ncbi:MAG: NADH-quinone oxidoreductase subunit L, partial [Bryobacteraceae bacterium]